MAIDKAKRIAKQRKLDERFNILDVLFIHPKNNRGVKKQKS